MKKKNLFKLGCCLVLNAAILASCNNSNSGNNEDPVETITDIRISGINSINIGQTVTLNVDVIGSDDDDNITTSSSDESILKVEGNRVTGVSEGSADFIVVSNANPSISSKYTIAVNILRAGDFSLTLTNNELVSYDKSLDMFIAPLGQEFDVEIIMDEGYSQDFTSSFSVVYPSDNNDGNFSITQDEDDNLRATCKASTAYSSITITCKIFYEKNTSTPSLQKNIFVKIVDFSKENVENTEILINSLDEENVVSSTRNIVTSTYVKETQSTSTVKNVLSSEVYENESYLYYSTYEDDELTSTLNYYRTIYESKYYAFTFNNDKSINSLISKESAGNNDVSTYFTIESSSILATHKNVLLNYFTSSTSSDVMFQESTAGAYAVYSFNDGNLSVTSTFEEDDVNYTLTFTLNYDESSKSIISYEFCRVIESDLSIITYTDKTSDIIYGTKTSSKNLINMDDYFFNSSNLEIRTLNDDELLDPDGRFDFSDKDKYYSEDPSVDDETGLDLYTLPTTQALVLKVKKVDNDDSIASCLIDTFTMESSDKEIVEPSDVLANTGSDEDGAIFVISPYKSQDATIKEGRATITITSLKGASYSFIIEFYKNELTSIKVSGATIDDDNSKFDLGEVFENQKSPNFLINGDPDDNSYTFKLVNVEGEDPSSLTLKHYEDGNEDGLYGYYIVGTAIGTYTFQIGCVGSDVVTTNTYQISIKEAYSADFLKEKLVNDNYFVYSNSSYSFSLKFVSETVLKLEQKNLIESTTTSQNLNYNLEKGRIVLEEQTLNSDIYFGFIKGDIEFNDDFSELTLKVALPLSEDVTNKTYYSITFDKYIDKSNAIEYLNGKTISTQEFMTIDSTSQMCTLTMSFITENSVNAGTLVITNKSGDTLVTIAFNYTYNNDMLNLTNIASSSTSVTFSDSYIYYDLNRTTDPKDCLEFKLISGSNSYRFYVEI